MYVTTQADIDLEDFMDDFIYMLKQKRHLREKVFSSLEGMLHPSVEKTIAIVDSDTRCHNLQKIMHNYWKLTSEEDELISKIADRF